MAKRITIIQGHPDRSGNHLGHALVRSYAKAAETSGFEVRHINVAELDLPLLRRKEDWEAPIQNQPGAQAIMESQQAIAWADHLVIVYPLWMGTMPALLKGFFEQVFRPGFAVAATDSVKMWEKRLAGKSARIVVTMGMPALAYRWLFRAHSLKSLQRNILSICGIKPVRASLIGMVDELDKNGQEKWLRRMAALGAKAA